MRISRPMTPRRPTALLPLFLLLCLTGMALADSERTVDVPGETVDVSGAPDASKLLRGMDELFESTGTTARVEIAIATPKKTRTMRMRLWSKGDGPSTGGCRRTAAGRRNRYPQSRSELVELPAEDISDDSRSSFDDDGFVDGKRPHE